MNVISKRVLFEKARRHSDWLSAIQVWFDTAVQQIWTSLEDIRKTFPDADMIGPLAIFNIRGNRYRLIIRITFRCRRVYIKDFLTHADYDKGGWKL